MVLKVVVVILRLLSTLIPVPDRLTQLMAEVGYPVAVQCSTRVSSSTIEEFPVTCTIGGTERIGGESN